MAIIKNFQGGFHTWQSSIKPLYTEDDWYDFFIYNSPDVLNRQENVQKWYRSWAGVMVFWDKLIENERYSHLISKANGEQLDVLGYKWGTTRGTLNNSEYRQIIKLAKIKKSFVPTVDNISMLIKSTTGVNNVSIETPTTDGIKSMTLNVITTLEKISEQIMESLDESYTAGKKLNFLDLDVLRHDTEEQGHDSGKYS